jgi:hypothetical protein
MARLRHPGGVLVAEDYLHLADALEATKQLIAESAPAIFEAAFESGGGLVRTEDRGRPAPVLERTTAPATLS